MHFSGEISILVINDKFSESLTLTTKELKEMVDLAYGFFHILLRITINESLVLGPGQIFIVHIFS
jgi:hypothetical protein